MRSRSEYGSNEYCTLGLLFSAFLFVIFYLYKYLKNQWCEFITIYFRQDMMPTILNAAFALIENIWIPVHDLSHGGLPRAVQNYAHTYYIQ